MTNSILKKLEYTREKMIRSGIENGFSNVETIRLSKKLDHLLNIYQLQNVNEMNDYQVSMDNFKH
ncbi:aspartyl-phosphate phosphatase Spo0E family protein [Viridibacillus sp. YIM B01967]|uniref:Aspartyl-phosphate phosphatase Spo0E family protein n=1 Tax=Viridibacillus soli TaxID=2798301 RepID=A0ABS1H7H5_9BACL|nr:aspartyl-phosphate phosphatase Spo0E family protein [Viridibacillus soli]MBK3495361.1 aspartyl-phosphate phosphatase Spo0E family protein [Viridibacillus soli]